MLNDRVIPFYEKYEKMNNKNHLSTLDDNERSDEIFARLNDIIELNNPSFFHFSLADIQEDAKFAKMSG